MIAYDEALSIVLSQAHPLGIQRVELDHLLGHVLAEPVFCPIDLPNFDNSAVDGFGVRVSDVESATDTDPVALKLLGIIRAGDFQDIEVVPGTAVKILTGAPIPKGVEAVVMQEYSRAFNGIVHLSRPAKMGENIRRKGEEFQKGQEVLHSGARITPPTLGLLASLGYPSFRVYYKPTVAIVVTGNELVPPGMTLQPGQIYESNSYSLIAALKAAGVDNCIVRWAKDDKESLRQELSNALENADIVITTGGVSVGECDYVKEILIDLHVESHFWKVAIKPGKPVYFGSLSNSQTPFKKLVFGLPGNPVAMLLTFQLLAKPALLKMMGVEESDSFKIVACLTHDLRKKPGRLEFVRGIVSSQNGKLSVKPAIGQGSHMLGGLSQANCLIQFPAEESHLPAGEKVEVELLNWSDS